MGTLSLSFYKKIRIIVLLVSVYAREEMKMRDTGPIFEDDVQEEMTEKRSQIAMVLLLLY